MIKKNILSNKFKYILGIHQILGPILVSCIILYFIIIGEINVIDFFISMYDFSLMTIDIKPFYTIAILICSLSFFVLSILTFVSGYRILRYGKYGRLTIISLITQIPYLFINKFYYVCASGLFNFLVVLNFELKNNADNQKVYQFSQETTLQIGPLYNFSLNDDSIATYGLGLSIIPLILLIYLIRKSKG